MDKGRKAWRKLESLKGLHDERERREKGEHKLRREMEHKNESAYKWGLALLK